MSYSIDWVKHETITCGSKSITISPAYPLGGGGNYQCSNTVNRCTTASAPEIDELREEIKCLRTRQAHAIVCSKCGGSFEFRGENGVCPYCGTHYSTRIVMEEMNKHV